MCQYCGNTGLCYMFFSAVGLKLFTATKNWLKRRKKEMKIEVLGMGCSKCKILYENVLATLKNAGK